MSSQKNIALLANLDGIITRDLKINKGKNKPAEIKRLLFEIFKINNFNRRTFLNLSPVQKYLKTGQFNYNYLKKILIKLRYPEYSQTPEFKEKYIYLPEIKNLSSVKEYKFSKKFIPEKIFVEKRMINNELAVSVFEKFPKIKPVIMDRMKDLRTGEKNIQTLGKNELFLVEENFDIFKPCPCTKNVFSCDYYILNTGFGCAYDCSFCYLQHYTDFPGIILPVNIKNILDHAAPILTKSKKSLRIGTGEFTDSLIFDDIIPYSRYLIPFIKNQKHILELKTKSINIKNLLEMDPPPNCVISWSLNTPSRIKKEEYYTPDLIQRLKAAGEVQKEGYKIGFHFDPIIYYEGWDKEYKETVETIYDHIKGGPEWISLGCLRFHRSLKPIIEMRFPSPGLLDGELLLDPVDNKMRYSEKIRIDIFKKMHKWIRKYDEKTVIYLCMEPVHIWKKVFGDSSHSQRIHEINLL